jgi:hypothetical protein
MRLKPLFALGAFSLVAVATAGCVTRGSDAAALRLQQPPLAADQAAVWRPQDRLYRSVTIDYVGGLWSHSDYRRELEASLGSAGLLAPTPAAARYALQVKFIPIKGWTNGAETLASYRILSRADNQIVFEQLVSASFQARLAALDGSIRTPVLGARRGVLAQEGYVTRTGQAEQVRMQQSITRFVIMLGDAEFVPTTTIVPCLDSAEVTALKGALTAQGSPWRTDNCAAYRERKGDDGLRFTSFQ